MTTTKQNIEVASIIRKLYIEADNKLIEVKQIDNPQDYASTTTLYTKQASKGATKGTTLYCVAVADYQARERASVDSITSLLANGMSAEQAVAKLTQDYASRLASKIARLQ